MKRKHLFLAIAALLLAAGFWLAREARRAQANHTSSTSNEASSMGGGVITPDGQPKPGHMTEPPPQLAPPDPSRRFIDFTPEERVEFARRGHGPGG